MHRPDLKLRGAGVFQVLTKGRIAGERAGLVGVAEPCREPCGRSRPLLTIGDQLVETIRKSLGLGARAARQRAAELLDQVGIDEAEARLNAYPHQFSGGQRQLVNLTRAFLRQPTIWLLDEPTASMDRNLELHITKALKSVIRPSDTLILVTHKGEMLELVERVIVIANHQVILDGPKLQVLQKLQTPVSPNTRNG